MKTEHERRSNNREKVPSKQEIEELYFSGLVQAEIGARFGRDQSWAFKLMKLYGIQARVAAKRDQRGDKNSYWKGDDAGIPALHKRIKKLRGQPQLCEVCGRSGPGGYYEWANLTGNYRDMDDYRRMCKSCHFRYDEKIKNIGHMRAKMEKVSGLRNQ